ncbi:hypothetical protein HU200_037580 [Digitaria exilis]|uniref:Uncharacterized protein n=1 Tax=Digitaria exilis TaxID=1010633 RepID=A0A835BE12_9POAL|nr:hypothetical protein HU200_037580 [Digitaria exilis]
MIIEARRQFGAKIFRELIIVACRSIWTHRNEDILWGSCLFEVMETYFHRRVSLAS